MVDMAALQARAYLDASGRDEEGPRRGRGPCAAQRPIEPVRGALPATSAPTTCWREPVTHDPLRDADIAPITDGTAAIVLAAGDLARSVCERPAWIRGIEHRIEAHSLGVRDLTTSESTRAAGAAAGVANGKVDVAELHAQFSHEELILAEALGLDAATP